MTISPQVNIVAFVTDRSKSPSLEPLPQPWVTQHTTDEVLSAYAGWGPDVLALLGCMENPSAWAIHSVKPLLETYSRGRVAVLGDAAHAMLPHLGAGAGQSLEDALLLVRLLSHPGATSANAEVGTSRCTVYPCSKKRIALVASSPSIRYDSPTARQPYSGVQRQIRHDLRGAWSEWRVD